MPKGVYTRHQRPAPAPVPNADGSFSIPLLAKDHSVRAYAIIDAADAEWLGQWRWLLRTPPDGRTRYAIRTQGADGRRVAIFMHREILGLPVISDGRQGDHINRDTLDNRRSNLRIVTHGQNLQNKASYRGSSSRYRGVSWNKRTQRWKAYIRVDGRLRSLGSFASEEDAAAAARAARARLMPYSVEATA